jgi:hypothetical protein
MSNKKRGNLIPITKNAAPAGANQAGPSAEQVEVMISRNNRSTEQLVGMLTDTVRAQANRIKELEAMMPKPAAEQTPTKK